MNDLIINTEEHKVCKYFYQSIENNKQIYSENDLKRLIDYYFLESYSIIPESKVICFEYDDFLIWYNLNFYEVEKNKIYIFYDFNDYTPIFEEHEEYTLNLAKSTRFTSFITYFDFQLGLLIADMVPFIEKYLFLINNKKNDGCRDNYKHINKYLKSDITELYLSRKLTLFESGCKILEEIIKNQFEETDTEPIVILIYRVLVNTPLTKKKYPKK